MRRHEPQVVALAVLVLGNGMGSAGAVEHPGVVPKDGQCTSCHAAKVRWKSVHSAMKTSARFVIPAIAGDMTPVSLSMPKQKICFACHQESAALPQHVPAAKGQGLDCHDPHSSERKMLLRAESPVSQGK